MSDVRRLVVVGGGITGLAAAHAAAVRARELGRPISITVLEGSARLGGNLITERVDGFLLDGGPDSWVASKPQATVLARDLGLASAIIGTNESTRRYYIAWGGRLHPVPEGLVLGVPTKWLPLAKTRLFTWPGKLRMAIEPFVVARRFEGDEDESIADFASRRLGREAADRLVAPLLGGIMAGDAGDLSVRAAFPQLVAMEQSHGSLVKGMRAAARARRATDADVDLGTSAGVRGSAFVSLRHGVGELIAALKDRLSAQGATLATGVVAGSLRRGERGWLVGSESGAPFAADAVVLAVPAHVAARLLADVDGELGAMLARVRYVSTATVFLAFRRGDVAHPLDGVGFVVPRSLGRPILASTWASSKWPYRAPEGHVLLRVFFGGAWGEDVLARPDDALAKLARRELGAFVGLNADPLWSRVFRFERASVQMRVGHLALMRAVRERLATLAPTVRVGGGGYDGFGIPDCVRQGREIGRASAGEGI